MKIDSEKIDLPKILKIVLNGGTDLGGIDPSLLLRAIIVDNRTNNATIDAERILEAIGLEKTVESLLASRLTISQVAEMIGCEYWPVYRLIQAKKIDRPPKQGRRLKAETIDEIKKLLFVDGLKPLEVMRRLKLSSRATIYSIVAKAIVREESRAGSFQPKKSKAWRCEKHGVVEFDECVACKAEAYKLVQDSKTSAAPKKIHWFGEP